MEVFSSFFIFYAITTCQAYDLEIEGVMRVGDEFLKKLNDDMYEFKKIQSPSDALVKPVPPFGLYSGEESRKTGEYVKRNETFISPILHSLNRMKKDGLVRLDKLQVIVNKNLKLNKSISDLITKASEEYATSLDKYFESTSIQVNNTELDFEFLILDLVDTSNKLLYSFQNTIFNEVVDANKGKILKDDIHKATEKMFKQNVNDKKRQMDLICEEHNVCRPFPGFTDYFADLLSELLKLSDDRLKGFLDIFQKALYNHIEFIQKIINERVLEKLKYHSNNLSADIGVIKDIISILRTVITQRHKVVVTQDDRLKKRTTALKILFDVVDKAFETEGEDMIAMNIDIVVQVLRHWKSRSQDIESIVRNFSKYFFNVLKQGISDDTKKELNILIEVILRGQSKNRSIYKYLLTKGSKFVRGEDLHMYSNML